MLSRIATMFLRYSYLHRRSIPRLLEVFFWPVMELLVWGFFARYMGTLFAARPADFAARLAASLLIGLIFWDVLYRSQQAVSLGLMEELWTRNILNLLISPLRTGEWIAAAYLYGLAKALIVAGALSALSALLYHFSIMSSLGLALGPLALNLLLMGFACGIFTAGLLLRWGHAGEALIWGIPFLIQPFSALFYPLSAYPAWLRPLCLLLPSTHVMEAMRSTLTGSFPWGSFLAALGLNALYMVAGTLFFTRMLERGRRTGQLIRAIE
ncbi:MAG TPA: ABC transporter permease [Elusimicrobiota bacterium]|jgi:ABC-2 type transport system permease protein|nr:ABC transporter permease [Elusimicrobiota bacterium]